MVARCCWDDFCHVLGLHVSIDRTGLNSVLPMTRDRVRSIDKKNTSSARYEQVDGLTGGHLSSRVNTPSAADVVIDNLLFLPQHYRHSRYISDASLLEHQTSLLLRLN